MTGRGTITFPDGTKLTAMFNSNSIPDVVRMRIDRHTLYIGQIANRRRQGLGKVVVKSKPGYEYIGEWSLDERRGLGVLTTAEFEYMGEFDEDEFNGQGRITYKKSGEMYEGGFSRG